MYVQVTMHPFSQLERFQLIRKVKMKILLVYCDLDFKGICNAIGCRPGWAGECTTKIGHFRVISVVRLNSCGVVGYTTVQLLP